MMTTVKDKTVLFLTTGRAANNIGLAYAHELAMNTGATLGIMIVDNTVADPQITCALDSLIKRSLTYKFDITCELCGGEIDEVIELKLRHVKGVTMIILGSDIERQDILRIKSNPKNLIVPIISIGERTLGGYNNVN